ncbi:Uncharacterised protein [Vibrio cholerae]|nr:Uncharacterised protein [Vibrio cholerae]
MPWGVDKVQLIGLAIFRCIVESHTLRFNGDATLTFQIHRVKNLLGHFTIAQVATDLD